MKSYFGVFFGGAIGSCLRFWLSTLVAQQFGKAFPVDVLCVNVIGSFIIGFFATLTGPDGNLLVASEMRQFVMIGILGGFTTFSSFSLETLNLIRDREWLWAGANIFLSVTLCLIAVWLGYTLALFVQNH